MIKRRTCQLELPSGALTLGQRTLLMGVLNVTPDSFSDGGKFLDAQRANNHAERSIRARRDEGRNARLARVDRKGAQGWSPKIANHPRSGYRVREKLRAKL